MSGRKTPIRKSPVLLVALALCAAILVAAAFLIATETRGRPPDPAPASRAR
jgi:hypothetical protein